MGRRARIVGRWALAAMVSCSLAMRPAQAQPAALADGRQLVTPLLLELTVNGRRADAILRGEELPGGVLLIERHGWKALGLVDPSPDTALSDGTPALRLSDVPGERHRLDRSALALHLDLPASAFGRSRIDLRGPATLRPSEPAAGMMLNYDASLQHVSGGASTTGGALLEAVGFGPWGHVVHSAVVRHDAQGLRSHRLDTYWHRDVPDRLETIVVGDTVGDGGAWSRPVRFAGLRWARNFRLQPGYVYQPTLSLAGESALPATVDVWVDNVRRLATNTQPGPFDLRNMPTVHGASEVNIVVRDVLGRETVVTRTFYTSPRLLAQGLSDFSFDAGVLRYGWGRDARYREGMLAATWRHGMTDATTAELRAELQRDRRAAGIDLATLLGHWALLRASLAATQGGSTGMHEHGGLLNLAIERSSRQGGFSLQHRKASQGYSPLGEGQDPLARALRMRSESIATVSLPLAGKATAGMSYARQRRWDGSGTQTWGLSATMPIASTGNLSISYSRQVASRSTWIAGLSYFWSWDQRTYGAARLDGRAGEPARPTVSAQRNAPLGVGTGWRIEASGQPSRAAAGSIQHQGEHAITTVDVTSDRDGQVALRTSAAGTVGLLGGHAYATRPVANGSLALVDTGGVAGVPVLRSQQLVATTDAQGRAIVPGLLPWTSNRISLEDSELPLDVELRDTVQEVVPASRGAVIVRFDLRRSLQALVVLRRADGSDVPVGAVVTTVPQNQRHTVGLRGEAWLTNLLAPRQVLRVEWSFGRCELTLPALDAAQPAPTLGPLTCHEVLP